MYSPNGAITDLGTLDGDCFSQSWAINSKGQIVGQSFSCDFSTVRTVLWDKGSIFDLGIASTEPLNINDPGEITGVYLPAGCDNSDLCSHAFVLVNGVGTWRSGMPFSELDDLEISHDKKTTQVCRCSRSA